MADTTNTDAQDDFVVALGNLINACTTLQSVIIGDIGSVERERALAHFDLRVQEAANARRQVFGDPSETPASAAVEPIADVDNTPTFNQQFDVTGRT